jgi:hypothetical protein
VPLKFHVGERLTVSRPGGIFSRLQRLGGDAPGLVGRERVCQQPAAGKLGRLLSDFAGSSSSLPTKNALHVGQSLLAGTLVTGAVGVTSPRHARLDCLYTLWRYLTKFRFRGCDRVRRWLTIHCGCSALTCGWPDGSIRFELGVKLGLHTVDPLRTRPRVTRRHQRSERSGACYDQSLNAHDFASASAKRTITFLGPHGAST